MRCTGLIQATGNNLNWYETDGYRSESILFPEPHLGLTNKIACLLTCMLIFLLACLLAYVPTF